ncbi:hypothetical protein J2T17_004033 [Paenibacillus mucilaginosus]
MLLRQVIWQKSFLGEREQRQARRIRRTAVRTQLARTGLNGRDGQAACFYRAKAGKIGLTFTEVQKEQP